MGSTLIEKIVARNIGAEEVHPGQIVTVKVDRVMIHDIFIPFVADKFKEMGFKKLWDPDKVVLIYDHLVPTSAVEDVLTPIIGMIFGAPDFSGIKIGSVMVGNFINAVINFLIIALCLFSIVKVMNKLKKPAPAAKPARKCPFCKGEIADDATRCPHCTSELAK